MIRQLQFSRAILDLALVGQQAGSARTLGFGGWAFLALRAFICRPSGASEHLEWTGMLCSWMPVVLQHARYNVALRALEPSSRESRCRHIAQPDSIGPGSTHHPPPSRLAARRIAGTLQDLRSSEFANTPRWDRLLRLLTTAKLYAFAAGVQCILLLARRLHR